jgi:hypothetical protein
MLLLRIIRAIVAPGSHGFDELKWVSILLSIAVLAMAYTYYKQESYKANAPAIAVDAGQYGARNR